MQKISQYTAFQFDSDSLFNVVKNQSGNVNFHLNIGTQYDWDFSLEAYDITAPGFVFAYSTENGIVMEENDSSDTYRGFLTGDSSSLARLLISGNAFSGFIQTPSEIYRINPIGFWVTDPADPDVFIVFKESDITETPPFQSWCPFVGTDPDNTEIIVRGENELYLDLAIDCDYEFFFKYDENVSSAVKEYIMLVDAAYSDQLNIRVLMSYLHVWMVPSPFEGNLSPGTVWDKFKNYWNANNACINRDVAVLLKGNSNGDWIGYVKESEGKGAICVGRGTSYALVKDRGSNAKVLGHELGHVLSAGHTSKAICENTCYLMCQSNDCAYGTNTSLWDFHQTSLNKINAYLPASDPQFPYYTHDWCLTEEPEITGPDVLCTNSEAVYHYSAFMAGDQFPTQLTTLKWTTGPGLSIVDDDPTAQTVTVKATGNGINSWVGVHLELTSGGAAHGFGCSNGSPVQKKEVHVGIPLSAGTPTIVSYWNNGAKYFNVGFGQPTYATQYEYSFQVYNVPIPYSRNGVTTDISPLITTIPQGGCFTATVYSGNECGFNYSTNNFPVTICFNDPLIKPDDTTALGEMQESVRVGSSKLTIKGLSTVKPEASPVFVLKEAVVPNPANEKIILRLPWDKSIVSIYEATGKRLFYGEFDKGVHEVASQDWQDGIYFVTIRTATGFSSHKLMLLH